jgi:hypothetical protein
MRSAKRRWTLPEQERLEEMLAAKKTAAEIGSKLDRREGCLRSRSKTEIKKSATARRAILLQTDGRISFDNFETMRRRRLVWRDGDFVGAAFES